MKAIVNPRHVALPFNQCVIDALSPKLRLLAVGNWKRRKLNSIEQQQLDGCSIEKYENESSLSHLSPTIRNLASYFIVFRYQESGEPQGEGDILFDVRKYLNRSQITSKDQSQQGREWFSRNDSRDPTLRARP